MDRSAEGGSAGAVVILGLVVVALLVLMVVDPYGHRTHYRYVAACRHDASHRRVSDDKCKRHTSGDSWLYVRADDPVPKVGGRLERGASAPPRNVPRSEVERGGLPAKGTRSVSEHGYSGGYEGTSGGTSARTSGGTFPFVPTDDGPESGEDEGE